MDKISYQVWLKAMPLKSETEKKKESNVLFSPDFGIKPLFKIFDILKSELSRPLEGVDLGAVRIIFNEFSYNDLTTNENIRNTINNHLKDLRDYDSLLKKIKKILFSLRERRIKFWETVIEDYLNNEERNTEELKQLCINTKSKFIDF